MNDRALRAAWLALGCHAALVAFSTAAMVTIVAGAAGDIADSEPAATIMRLSFRFAGPTYVMLGALCGLLFLAWASNWRVAVVTGLVASSLALAAELVGTATSLPFGDYAYSGMLGYQVLGLVPFPIPVSWFYMLVGSLGIVARFRTVPGTAAELWIWSLIAGLLMVAWDLAMDPAMVRTGHWRWGTGDAFRDSGLPGAVVAFFTADAFYGMPLSNWVGWLLTATLIARVILALVPVEKVAQAMSSSSLPIFLYTANGIMPVALCVRHGLWWAAAAGTIAMLVPATMAMRRSHRIEYFRHRTA